MEDKVYHENEEYNKDMLISVKYLAQASAGRDKYTHAELQDIRLKLGVIRAKLTLDVLLPIANEVTYYELIMKDLEGKGIHNYFEKLILVPLENDEGEIVTDSKGNAKKKYPASVADSLARKAIHTDKTAFYKAKSSWMYLKNFEKVLFQHLKAIDNVEHGLAAVAKIT